MAPTMTTAATMLRSTKPVRVSHQKVLQFIVSQKKYEISVAKVQLFLRMCKIWSNFAAIYGVRRIVVSPNRNKQMY